MISAPGALVFITPLQIATASSRTPKSVMNTSSARPRAAASATAARACSAPIVTHTARIGTITLSNARREYCMEFPCRFARRIGAHSTHPHLGHRTVPDPGVRAPTALAGDCAGQLGVDLADAARTILTR